MCKIRSIKTIFLTLFLLFAQKLFAIPYSLQQVLEFFEYNLLIYEDQIEYNYGTITQYEYLLWDYSNRQYAFHFNYNDSENQIQDFSIRTFVCSKCGTFYHGEYDDFTIPCYSNQLHPDFTLYTIPTEIVDLKNLNKDDLYKSRFHSVEEFSEWLNINKSCWYRPVLSSEPKASKHTVPQRTSYANLLPEDSYSGAWGLDNNSSSKSKSSNDGAWGLDNNSSSKSKSTSSNSSGNNSNKSSNSNTPNNSSSKNELSEKNYTPVKPYLLATNKKSYCGQAVRLELSGKSIYTYQDHYAVIVVAFSPGLTLNWKGESSGWNRSMKYFYNTYKTMIVEGIVDDYGDIVVYRIRER